MRASKAKKLLKIFLLELHTIVYRAFSRLALSLGHLYKGGQVTTPVIVVKMPCKLYIVCHLSEKILNVITSWPQSL